jgi:predicted transcriptional regulator of viral defense system
MVQTKKELLVKKLKKTGILSTSDIEKMGISREYIRKLLQDNVLVRIKRSLYRLPNKSERIDRVLKDLETKGIMTSTELSNSGINRMTLKELVDDGRLIRVERGLYTLPEGNMSEFRGFAEASRKISRGVICLLSALQFYNLTTYLPHRIWIAIEDKWTPATDMLPLNIVHFSGKAFSEGIEKHVIDGVEVSIYSPAKTIADCFKFKNKIGKDIAIEALKNCLKEKLCTVDDIWHYSNINRVEKIVVPYLEALT